WVGGGRGGGDDQLRRVGGAAAVGGQDQPGGRRAKRPRAVTVEPMTLGPRLLPLLGHGLLTVPLRRPQISSVGAFRGEKRRPSVNPRARSGDRARTSRPGTSSCLRPSPLRLPPFPPHD